MDSDAHHGFGGEAQRVFELRDFDEDVRQVFLGQLRLVATAACVQADVAAARGVVRNAKRELVFLRQRVDVLDHLLLKLLKHLPADV